MKLEFGDRLKKVRMEQKLTMRELANRLGVSHSLIGLLEHEIRPPSIELLRKFAEYTGEDPRLMEFIASPMPNEYKRIISESEAAPDFIKTSEFREELKNENPIEKIFIGLFNKIIKSTIAEDRTFYRRFLRELQETIGRTRGNAWIEFLEILLDQGEGQIDKLQEFYKKLSNDVSLQNETQLRLKVATTIAAEARLAGKFDLAIRYGGYNKAINYSISDADGETSALQHLAETYKMMGDNDRAIELCEEALKLKDASLQTRARVMMLLSELLREENKLDLALDLSEESTQIWKSGAISKPILAARSYNLSTLILIAQKNSETASDYNRRAADMLRRVLANSGDDRVRTFSAYIELAWVRYSRALLVLAKSQTSTAIEIATEIIGDYHNLAGKNKSEADRIIRLAYAVIANSQEQNSNFNEAETAYFDALNFATESADRVEIFMAMHKFYLRQQMSEKAEEILQRCHSTFADDENFSGDARLYPIGIELSWISGEFALTSDDLTSAIRHYMNSCEFASKISASKYGRVLMKLKSKVDQLRNDGELTTAQNILDAINSIEKIKGALDES